MGCCGQTDPGAGLAATDSCKRVNYTLGMLLGVDDFVQESLYNGSRRREEARELHGYGTVHGLKVAVEADGDRGPRLRVAPGMGWLPSGTAVCVDSEQCASLNDWLAVHAAEVQAALAASAVSPPRLTLYLVLAHVECLTDNVPIPGEPCRSEDELMQPSRIADSFRLELRLAPVAQREEDGLRDFVDWLVRQPLAPSSPPLDEDAFIEQVRLAAHDWLDADGEDSPPLSPPRMPDDYMRGEAPAGTNELLFRTALRLWATELRPLWMARADCSCGAQPLAPQDDVLLLALLDIGLVATLANGGWRVGDGADAVTVDESRRPILLSVRMVQELILRQWGADPGDTVIPETAFGQAPDPGVSLDYARADHTHGSPVLPALGGDLSGPIEAARIEALQGTPLLASSPLADGQVLTFEAGAWIAREVTLPELGGDVSGAAGANRIDALQGVPLATASPLVDGQVLTFEAGQWIPRAVEVVLPDLAGDIQGPPGATVIAQLQGSRVDAAAPAEGQVLRFSAGAWVAAELPEAPPAPAGQFVGRGTPEPYQIVAAGEVQLTLRDSRARGAVAPPGGYGELEVVGAEVDRQAQTNAVINLRARVEDAEKLPNYIVKLTPIWSEVTKFGFRLYLLDKVRTEGRELIDFRVLLVADQQIVDGSLAFRFQVEVSRF